MAVFLERVIKFLLFLKVPNKPVQERLGERVNYNRATFYQLLYLAGELNNDHDLHVSSDFRENKNGILVRPGELAFQDITAL